MSIDLDKFKQHTQNLATMARENNDKDSELFFLGVLDYINKYAEVFKEEDN